MNAQTITRLKKQFIPAILIISAALVSAGIAHAGIEEHIVKTETGFYYTVQKGDTLWDLSEKFADSPWQWPNLWHYNPEIKNPHLIYPGQKIRIYQKDFYGEKKAPEPEKKAEPEAKQYFTFSKINSVGFIRQQAVNPLGVLFQDRHNTTLIGTDSQVYIRPQSPASLSIGEIYFTYRTISPIRDPQTKDYIGVQHLLTGIVEINELKQNLAIGKVISSFREITEGDMLMPFMQRNEKIEIKPGIEGIGGKLIKSEDDWKLIGEQIIAFIDRGADHGVETGQRYQVLTPITKNRKYRADKPEKLNFEKVGELMVLSTEDTTATVLITYSGQDLAAGMPIQAMR